MTVLDNTRVLAGVCTIKKKTVERGRGAAAQEEYKRQEPEVMLFPSEPEEGSREMEMRSLRMSHERKTQHVGVTKQWASCLVIQQKPRY